MSWSPQRLRTKHIWRAVLDMGEWPVWLRRLWLLTFPTAVPLWVVLVFILTLATHVEYHGRVTARTIREIWSR